jgi:hypothetical protein
LLQYNLDEVRNHANVAGREPKEIATVECVALDKGADLRVYQGAQWFKSVEHKAMTMGFVEVKIANRKAGTGRGEHCTETACFLGIGKVQHGVDRVRRMASAGLSDATGAVLERSGEPRWHGSPGARYEP